MDNVNYEDAINLLQGARLSCKDNQQAMRVAQDLQNLLRDSRNLEHEMDGIVNFGCDNDGIAYTASAATSLLEDSLLMVERLTENVEILKTHKRLEDAKHANENQLAQSLLARRSSLGKGRGKGGSK